MKTLSYLSSLVLLCILLTGCGGDSVGSSPATPPSAAVAGVGGTSDVLRVGDKVTIRLEGVPDGGYVTEVQIPSSGEITVPLLSQSFHATGRNSADVAAEITAAYKEAKLYTTPNVTVISEERYVNIGGDVRSPSRVLYTPDLTLLSAINSCGGFSEYAKRSTVRILRGKQVIIVNCVTAASTPGSDPALYPGDQVFVPRTMF